MTDLLRRHLLLIISFLLIFFSTQLMNASVKNRELPQFGARLIDSALGPAQKAFHEVSDSTEYVWNRYFWLMNVESERDALEERVRELESRNLKLKEYREENIRLRLLLDFSEKRGHRGVVATVVGKDPSNWRNTITIDRGLEHGVCLGCAVVDGNAIIGQTIAVSRNTTRVLLLTDSASAIDALVQSSRTPGIVEGGADGGMLRMRYVEKLEESVVRPGDSVISSGLDGVFPKGISIGVVHEVKREVAGLFQQVLVKPQVDTSRLENVMVIVPQNVSQSISEEN